MKPAIDPATAPGVAPRDPAPRKFTDVYDACVDLVNGYIAHRISNRLDAEALTQGTFEKALKSWSRFDPQRSTVTTWLLAIARNSVSDYARRAARSPQVAISDGDATGLVSTPDSDPVPYELSCELADALDRLPDRAREVIALKFGAGLLSREVADILKTSTNNVDAIVSRRLKSLRGSLGGR